jgi:hypothetical protein
MMIPLIPLIPLKPRAAFLEGTENETQADGRRCSVAPTR